MELKITKERVLEAAKISCQAKQTLRILFPEFFTKELDLKKINNHFNPDLEGYSASEYIISVRGCLKYEGKAFFLSSKYDWSLEIDEDNSYILIPTTK